MTFSLRRHILQKKKYKTYLKCRVAACPLAYITFNTVKSLNTHHTLYHPNITYKCKNCNTTVMTPSSWKYHKYCQKPKLVTCDICNKKFTYSSRMRQHRRSHMTQKHFKCFHGKCNKVYKHPQDLTRHTAMHMMVKYECELCDKRFKQKRLLQRHEAIHSTTLRYNCQECNAKF